MTPAPERIEGWRLALRLVRPEDAEYIHALRVDPAYNSHLSRVTGTAADQRRWIEAYKLREAAGTEAYYVIERLSDGGRCGVVRLYEIEGDRFTWGSWILDAGKPPKAALESAVLSFGIGFDRLGLAEGVLDVRRENTHAQAFYRRFGMRQTGADDTNLYFAFSREDFASRRRALVDILKAEAASHE